MKRLKFLGGISWIIVVCIFLPTILYKCGLLPTTDISWLVILVAGGGMLFKSVIADMVGTDFSYHKFGFDNCIIAFGGVLTACVLQLKSTLDCYPGLSVSLLGRLDTAGGDLINSRKIELFILLGASLLFVLFTANNSKIIKTEETKSKNLLAFLNTIAGTFMLMTYLYILILKS